MTPKIIGQKDWLLVGQGVGKEGCDLFERGLTLAYYVNTIILRNVIGNRETEALLMGDLTADKLNILRYGVTVFRLHLGIKS